MLHSQLLLCIGVIKWLGRDPEDHLVPPKLKVQLSEIQFIPPLKKKAFQIKLDTAGG